MSGFGTTTQTAIYGVTRFQILDPLKLIAGGRLSRWTRDEEEALYTPEAYRIEHKNIFTPYAGLILDFTDYLSAYASYTSIFNPQTARDRDGHYLDPLERSEEHTSELQSLMRISYAVFCLKKKQKKQPTSNYYKLM